MKKKMKKKLLVMSVFLSMLVFTDLSFSEVQEEIVFCNRKLTLLSTICN